MSLHEWVSADNARGTKTDNTMGVLGGGRTGAGLIYRRERQVLLHGFQHEAMRNDLAVLGALAGVHMYLQVEDLREAFVSEQLLTRAPGAPGGSTSSEAREASKHSDERTLHSLDGEAQLDGDDDLDDLES